MDCDNHCLNLTFKNTLYFCILLTGGYDDGSGGSGAGSGSVMEDSLTRGHWMAPSAVYKPSKYG